MSGSVSMIDGHIDPDKGRMTDKEIIQALECCGTATCISNSCPYEKIHDIPTCTTKLTRDALDLINRQQAENKALKTENLILSQKRFNIFERIEFTDKLKKQAKSKAIKEFAERYKNLLETELHWCECADEIIKPLDNLVKEMVGEQE
jgi:hypothetical protein